MTTQPEALQLAELFESYAVDHQPEGWPAIRQEVLNSAAAELRRLHAENEELRAALEQPGVEPVAGWKLVPVEPTPEMLQAGRETPCSASEEDCAEDYRAVYKAMLEAAPQPARPVQWVEPVASDYKQEPGSKNCMQVAAAYMMGVPLADVPDFERYGPDAWDMFYAFFADRGFSLEMLPPNMEINGDYLASGETERGTSHIVVMRGGALLHDPHPSNAGLKSVQVVWLITRRAGLCTAPQPAQQPVQEPIGYFAFRNGEPSWDDDCVCKDPVYPVGADDDRVSQAIYTTPPDTEALLNENRVLRESLTRCKDAGAAMTACWNEDKKEADALLDKALYVIEAWERYCDHEDYWRDRDELITAIRKYLGVKA